MDHFSPFSIILQESHLLIREGCSETILRGKMGGECRVYLLLLIVYIVVKFLLKVDVKDFDVL